MRLRYSMSLSGFEGFPHCARTSTVRAAPSFRIGEIQPTYERVARPRALARSHREGQERVVPTPKDKYLIALDELGIFQRELCRIPTSPPILPSRRWEDWESIRMRVVRKACEWSCRR